MYLKICHDSFEKIWRIWIFRFSNISFLLLIFRYNNKPFEFVLGEGQVIQGWEAGLLDMCKGEVRHLSIPPMYAWGHGGMGGIPSRVTLYFFVRLESFHAIADAPRKINTFAIIDVNQDGLLSRDEVRDHWTDFLMEITATAKNKKFFC